MTIHKASNSLLFSDLLPYSDPMTTITSDHPSTQLQRNKYYQSTSVESRKRLFNSSKKLKEELGVRFIFE